MNRIGFGIGVLLFAVQARGQDVAVSFSISPARVYLGDTVVVQLRVENATDPSPPEIPSTDDYAVSFQGQGSSSQFRLTINGRQINRSATTTFTYLLQPLRSGRMRIPPITFEHQGREYRTGAATLTVIEPSEQDRVFLEISTDTPDVYVEQPVQVEVTIWLRRLQRDGRVLDVDPLVMRNPPQIDISWLDALEGTETEAQREFLPRFLNEKVAGFSINGLSKRAGFFDFDRSLAAFMFPRSRATRLGLNGEKHDYFVYRFRKRYVPLSIGTLTFAPARFKGQIPVEVTPAMRIRRTVQVLAFSKPLIVQVRPVPKEGRPDSYCGAVGRVDLRVSAKPTEVNVGDPITLTMRLSGSARMESVGAPPLASNETLVREFRVPEDPLGGVMKGKAKVFTQTIRALSDSVVEIPPIEVSYFDPEKAEFVTVSSKAIRILVSPASLLDTGDVIAYGDDPAASRLTTLSGGIQANYTDVDALLEPERATMSWPMFAVPGGGPLLYVCVLFWKRRHDRLAGDVAFARRRRAYREAGRELDRIATQAIDAQSLDAIAACLLGYVADRCNRADGSMTRPEAAAVLRRAQVDEALIGRFDGLLETCELARYARVDESSDAIVTQAGECLRELEPCRF